MIMLSLFFKPESELFNSATKEYKDIWKSEEEKIIKAFKVVTRLLFQYEGAWKWALGISKDERRKILDKIISLNK